MTKYKLIFILLLCLMLIPSAAAQDVVTLAVTPTVITINAEDGQELVGDLYIVDQAGPTVLLLHELYATRQSWTPLIGPLLGSGYNVLAVDLRGYGATRGNINWLAAVEDVQTWLDWLRDEAGVRGNGISIIGSSMGANLAIVGCGSDTTCRTVIGISAGWRYYGIGVGDAFANGLASKSALLIYSDRDRWPTLGTPRIKEVAGGLVEEHVYPGNTHGKYLFSEQEDLIPTIINWLNLHGR